MWRWQPVQPDLLTAAAATPAKANAACADSMLVDEWIWSRGDGTSGVRVAGT